MKRLISLVLLTALFLSGCGQQLKEPVTFYYIRSGYDEDMSSVIGTEEKEASGHRTDLSYLMALYFMGPASEDLRSPFPGNTGLISAEHSGPSLILHLSDTSDSITDAQFTVACACLTLTCLELTDAEHVTINSGSRSVTMGADALLLQDLTTAAHTEETP